MLAILFRWRVQSCGHDIMWLWCSHGSGHGSDHQQQRKKQQQLRWHWWQRWHWRWWPPHSPRSNFCSTVCSRWVDYLSTLALVAPFNACSHCAVCSSAWWQCPHLHRSNVPMPVVARCWHWHWCRMWEEQMLSKVVQKIPHHKSGRCFSLISQNGGSQ